MRTRHVLAFLAAAFSCTPSQPSAEGPVGSGAGPLATPSASTTMEAPSATQTASATVPAPMLKLSVRADPASPTKAELANMDLHFVVENVGPGIVDPRLEDSVLLVDGKPNGGWPMTINNGPRDARWKALPPRDRLEFAYRLGGSLFASLGPHTVVLELHGVQSAPTTITLRP